MPSRMPPCLAETFHQLTPTMDVDWTTEGAPDWETELRRREERNILIRDMLKEGRTVVYRSSGNSLWPRVKSGWNCKFGPVTDASQVSVGDIVFCRILRRGYYYAHIVKEKWWDDRDEWLDAVWPNDGGRGGWKFTICNITTYTNGYGPVNGQTDMDNLWGKLLEAKP